MSDGEIYGTFGEHLEELRKALIRAFVVIGIGFLVSLLSYTQIFDLLTLPLKAKQEKSSTERQILKRERIVNQQNRPIYYTVSEDEFAVVGYSEGTRSISNYEFLLPAKGYIDIDIPEQQNLLILSPTEGIGTVIKTCFWMGLIATSPLWLYFIMQFITPALTQSERGLAFYFILSSILFLSIGVLFGFFVTIPIANGYLYAFNDSIGLNFWTLSHYLDYTIFLTLANGLAFESCVILFFLIRYDVLKLETMIKYQKHAIVLSLIIGALLTPPDIFTQLLLALPLIALYELLLVYALIRRASVKASTIVN